jgi:primosomal protein N''
MTVTQLSSTDPLLTRALAGVGACGTPKRPRGEKKPIPEDQKDEKYYERRKRNNQAAKKSRDARKIREDQVSLDFKIKIAQFIEQLKMRNVGKNKGNIFTCSIMLV